MDELLEKLGIATAQVRIEVALDRDFSKLALTPEEAFLLSRIDTCSSLQEVFMVSTFSSDATKRMLLRFAKEGWVRPATPLPPAPKAKRPDPFITEVEKKFAALKTPGVTPHAILEVPQAASLAQAKSAFLKLTKVYHPDRLFRKGRQEDAAMLDAIFQALNHAMDAFKEANKKPKNSPTSASAIKAKTLDNAIAERLRQAKLLVKQAAEQAVLDPVAALNTLKLAQSFDTQSEEIKILLRDVTPRANRKKAEKIFNEGVGHEDLLSYDEALRCYEQALEWDPKNATYLRKMAEFLLYRVKDGKKALICAQKAVELEAKNVDNHMILGFIYKDLGAMGHAKACFEHVLKLDKGNLFAKNELAHLPKNPNHFKH